MALIEKDVKVPKQIKEHKKKCLLPDDKALPSEEATTTTLKDPEPATTPSSFLNPYYYKPATTPSSSLNSYYYRTNNRREDNSVRLHLSHIF